MDDGKDQKALVAAPVVLVAQGGAVPAAASALHIHPIALPMPAVAVPARGQKYGALPKAPPPRAMPPLPRQNDAMRYFNESEHPTVPIQDLVMDAKDAKANGDDDDDGDGGVDAMAVHERQQQLTPLEWWKRNAAALPVLARIARRYLAIPATSTEPERMWSAAGRLCTDTRGSLAPETIEMQLFLHHNRSLI